MAAALRTETSAISDLGAVRSVNEDRFIARPENGLWAVADGMGGHAQGDWAAQAVIDDLNTLGRADTIEAMIEDCANAIHGANAKVFQESAAKGVQMGTTVAALIIDSRRFGVLWAGDSRVYLLRVGQLHQLTRDHTQVQEMVDRGLLSEDAAQGHPMGHVLARAIGVSPTVAVDVVTDAVMSGDIFLICSDGLYGALSHAEIIYVLSNTGIENVADELISRSLANGAKDNVTAIIIRAQEPTLLVLAGGVTAQ